MIKGRLIVCIASSWDYDPTSKHHLMRLLARENKVLWVNYHGTRKPGSHRGDLRAVLSTLQRFAGGMRRINDNMVQITPLVLPGASRRPLVALSEFMLARQIELAVRRVDPDRQLPVQLWTFAPDVAALAGKLQEESLVYYCVDDYAQFQGLDRSRIEAGEEQLLRKADVVITTSRALQDSRSRTRPDSVLIRHGVDFERFCRAWSNPPPPPADLADIPRPIFGFFGLIHHWIDLDLLAEVARLRPKYSFVLIGEPRVDTKVLAGLDNVHLLGRRSYTDLPAYCAQFTAGLLLFARTGMTENVNPIKLYEYLAAGLPVISTSIPEAARIGPPVQLADTAKDYAEACDQALAGSHDPRQISALVAHETWESRVEWVSELVVAEVERTRSRRDRRLPLPAERLPHVVPA